MVRKSTGVHDRISSDPAISGHELPMRVRGRNLTP
jgi:hypothetical protein